MFMKDIGKKNIYIYGGGVFGLCVFKWLRDNDYKICGIIDKRADDLKNKQYMGVDIIHPRVLAGLDPRDSLIVITASKPQSVDQIIKTIKDYSKDFEYEVMNGRSTIQIDISGMCNLKCKSCPVGNSPSGVFNENNRNFMTPECYEKIIKKIKKELPENRCIFLYIFGDPCLSPYLTEIIDITHKYGLFAIISTNLSMSLDIQKLIKHQPDCIKVSVSGYTQDIYGSTHNNGDVRLVKSNLYQLRYYMDILKKETNIVVGYHLYNNNQGESSKMEELCKELGFLFQPVKAAWNNNHKKMGLDKFEPEDIKFITSYYENYKEILLPLSTDYGKDKYCGLLEEGLFIDWDGRVLLCCTMRREDAKLPFYYLDVSLEQIKEERKKHYICNECIAHNLEWRS